MAISIPSVITITGLATALAVGGFMHYKTVDDLNTQIKDLKELSAAPLSSEDMHELHDIIAGFTVESAPIQGGDAPDNWIYGSAKARFTLVEFTDTECPYCKDHFPILKSLIDTSGGQINAALVHVPALSEASRQQALAIECAGEQGGSETAWKYAQLVFDSTGGNGKGVSSSLAGLASKLKLDAKRFSACLDSTAVIERVMSDMEHAIALQLKQTPSTMVLDNVTGNSIVLQGANATQEGILDAMAKVSRAGAQQ
ncbi:TPA: disulfide bond formation protein DsbA [Pseudomonas aeruginosa]|uniref:DsbA family protein n=1 Tax=Pseudomonas qingdaonensis TaxID=2056231 RepID=UPI00265EBEAD|nr:thioredoxin domain-containing protein [Pseudomonas qingdaonensis]HBP5920930.1 disulfide bond formation protein DsbA [Pseudomonas aeruginosa]WKL67271.1 thioredoxin domain-containing protein [Pseudomonas qingdaonensis]HBP5921910.1 disulfide bond formation protein DsbA [Pseudomonas aeruginosa]HBP5954170.1 disulfide bond formation protein DsbA [Pseudomonas aeruginosa]HBP6061858.1 disulfide bond formation protein DsbA [Pseudomonas aeruginosa]